MKDLFVRRAYTSYGITIVVEMDFVKKTISLTEKDGTNKKFIFKEFEALDEKDHEHMVEMFMALDKALKKGEGDPNAKPKKEA